MPRRKSRRAELRVRYHASSPCARLTQRRAMRHGIASASASLRETVVILPDQLKLRQHEHRPQQIRQALGRRRRCRGSRAPPPAPPRSACGTAPAGRRPRSARPASPSGSSFSRLAAPRVSVSARIWPLDRSSACSVVSWSGRVVTTCSRLGRPSERIRASALTSDARTKRRSGGTDVGERRQRHRRGGLRRGRSA